MRDLFVLSVVVAALPVVLVRPFYGILLWSWLGYMNPHRLGWGFAREFPFAMIVALVTLTALLIANEKKRIPWTRETILLVLFILWMVVSTIFALEQQLAWQQLEKVAKIQLMTFVTIMLLTSKERVNLLVLVIVLSLGFYGVKGGIFTLTTGGQYRVQGPFGTFIGGNNEIGLALIMTMPLMRYLQLQTTNQLLKISWTGAMLLTLAAIVGTQSRGALVGLIAMGALLFLKSRRKFLFAIPFLIVIPMVLTFMPESWWQRMETIGEYETDRSAQGRINAWWMAYNLALDRPLTGGGFEVFRQPWFGLYAPNPWDSRDVHSIYFEVLGEHGFVGFGLFMALGLSVWLLGNSLRRRARADPGLRWAGDLGSMAQVSAVGYAAGGAFLGLAYFDLYYHLIAMLVAARAITDNAALESPALKEKGQALGLRREA